MEKEKLYIGKFINLPEFKYNDINNRENMFLMGEKMIEQKENKNIGDEVSVYEIIKQKNNSIIYKINYYILKGD